MKSSLSARLDLIRRAAGNSRFPAGDNLKAEMTAKNKAVDEIPGWTKKSDYVFFRQKNIALSQVPELVVFPASDIQLSRLCVFDTETTGLSSGAGTVIFLAGTGRIRKDTLQIRQYFLADYPGERDFLELLLTDLSEDSVYVTYNGKAFDFSLLKSRLSMNALQRDFPNQIDLLHPMRRLMKMVRKSCSQKDCEEVFLGVVRKNDIPGSLIPFLYKKFLDSSETSVLLPVFMHHFWDIQNLATLFFWLQSTLSEPHKKTVCNRFELARLLMICNREKGLAFMYKLASEGDISAKFATSLLLKKEKETENAAALWEELSSVPHFHALIELAKYCEHKKKDLNGAIHYCTKALACEGLTPGQKKSCQMRIQRLREKLSCKIS